MARLLFRVSQSPGCIQNGPLTGGLLRLDRELWGRHPSVGPATGVVRKTSPSVLSAYHDQLWATGQCT
jgi:hypothetical protein